MNHQIEVIVSGPSGAGKSAVARVIELALVGLGVSVKRVDDNGTGQQDEPPGVIEEWTDKRMKSLVKRGLNVTVKTKNLYIQTRRLL